MIICYVMVNCDDRDHHQQFNRGEIHLLFSPCFCCIDMFLCGYLVKLFWRIFFEKLHGLWNDDCYRELSKSKNQWKSKTVVPQRKDGWPPEEHKWWINWYWHVVVRQVAYGANPGVKCIYWSMSGMEDSVEKQWGLPGLFMKGRIIYN